MFIWPDREFFQENPKTTHASTDLTCDIVRDRKICNHHITTASSPRKIIGDRWKAPLMVGEINRFLPLFIVSAAVSNCCDNRWNRKKFDHRLRFRKEVAYDIKIWWCCVKGQFLFLLEQMAKLQELLILIRTGLPSSSTTAGSIPKPSKELHRSAVARVWLFFLQPSEVCSSVCFIFSALPPLKRGMC